LTAFREIKRGNNSFRVIDSKITSSWSYWDLYCDGRWEAATLKAIDDNLPEGGLLFDIGAWIGPMTLWAAKNRKAHVVAVEPDPEAFLQLCDNVAANQLHNVICLNLAVSPDGLPAQLGMQVSGDSCSSLTQKGKSSIQVETVTMGGLVLKYGKPDLIKMDIEGGESLLIPGGLEVSKLEMPVIIALHPQWYVPNSKITEELSKCNMKLIESNNYLCIPKRSV
jgi:FkbM family methyltransferase